MVIVSKRARAQKWVGPFHHSVPIPRSIPFRLKFIFANEMPPIHIWNTKILVFQVSATTKLRFIYNPRYL